MQKNSYFYALLLNKITFLLFMINCAIDFLGFDRKAGHENVTCLFMVAFLASVSWLSALKIINGDIGVKDA